MKIYDRRRTGMKFIICSVCAVWVVMGIAFAQEGQSPPKMDPKPPVLVPLPGPQPVPGPKMNPIPPVPVPLPGPVIIRDFPPYVPDDPNDRDFPLPVPDDPNDDEGELPTPEELYRTPLSPEAMEDMVTEFRKKYTVKDIRTDSDGIPTFINGDLAPSNAQGDVADISYAFLEENKDLFQMNNPREELIVKSIAKYNNATNIGFSQMYKGIAVYDGYFYVRFTSNNRIESISNLYKHGISISTVSAVSRQTAENIVSLDFGDKYKNESIDIIGTRKVIYGNKGTYQLIWGVSMYGNSEYFIGANSGDILYKGTVGAQSPPEVLTPLPLPRNPPIRKRIPKQKATPSSVDFSPFEKICDFDFEYYSYQCRQPLSELHCDYFLRPLKYFAWLEPRLPILTCENSERAPISGKGVYQVAGWGWTLGFVSTTRYVVFQNGEPKLIGSVDEFRNIFSPVQTGDEALAFVAALNKGSLVFDIQPLMNLKGGQYKVSQHSISKTSALKMSGGFIVNAYSGLGMCSTMIYRKNLLVKTNGEIEEKDSTLIWESDTKPRCIA